MFQNGTHERNSKNVTRKTKLETRKTKLEIQKRKSKNETRKTAIGITFPQIAFFNVFYLLYLFIFL